MPMTDTAALVPPPRSRIGRALADRLLGALSLLLLAIVLVAVARGHASWSVLPWPAWAHLLTIAPVLALTPFMLGRPKGNRRHRILGYIWLGLMATTAAISFAVRLSNPGHLSWIHLLSAWVLIQCGLIVQAARAHNIVRHRARVRGLVIGGLLIAGFFTLPFGRLLGQWLTG